MTRKFITLALLLVALPAAAAVYRHDRFSEKLTIDPNGSLSIENPFGSITIIGGDEPGLKIDGVRTVGGIDSEAVQEGQAATNVQYDQGNERARFLRTVQPLPTNPRWQSHVDYIISIPKTVHVNVVNRKGEFIRISNMTGNVFVKHVSGRIDLSGLSGAIMVETVNGQVTVKYPSQPRMDSTITSINGAIEVAVPPNAKFEWLAQTLRGDILTSLPVKGQFIKQPAGRAFRASVNGAKTPRIVTNAITGKAFLLANGQPRTLASLQEPRPEPRQVENTQQAQTTKVLRPQLNRIRTFLIKPPSAQNFEIAPERVDSNFEFTTPLGNILIQELNGNGRLFTRAGEIVLGKVSGSVVAQSGGGPLNLGDISGPLNAKTTAGDVMVNFARRGGTISTDAGNIQVNFAGGRVDLFSGGGDITLRRASAPVRAVARSGDISVSMDGKTGSPGVEARTRGGNILLNLPPSFAADIDATTVTLIGEANTIQSDFAGLEISTETIGDKIRTRAVGKINGGGEKIILSTENGTIHLRSRIPSATQATR